MFSVMKIFLFFFSLAFILEVSCVASKYDNGVVNSFPKTGNRYSEEDMHYKQQIPVNEFRKRLSYARSKQFAEKRHENRKSLTALDFQIGATLPKEYFDANESALYSSKYFEGDIFTEISARNAIRQLVLKWPNANVPYEIDPHYSSRERAVIARAMQGYHENTCIRFVARNSSHTDYLSIGPDDGCYSQVGRVGGKQIVSLDKGCVFVGTAQHELMHAIGFWHEQSRADRDDHITILWENVKNGMEYNFDKYSLDYIQHLGVHYDYTSIMHYGPYAFAKGDFPTIVAKREGVTFGQRKGLSSIDVKKINRLYRCKSIVRNCIDC